MGVKSRSLFVAHRRRAATHKAALRPIPLFPVGATLPSAPHAMKQQARKRSELPIALLSSDGQALAAAATSATSARPPLQRAEQRGAHLRHAPATRTARGVAPAAHGRLTRLSFGARARCCSAASLSSRDAAAVRARRRGARAGGAHQRARPFSAARRAFRHRDATDTDGRAAAEVIFAGSWQQPTHRSAATSRSSLGSSTPPPPP